MQNKAKLPAPRMNATSFMTKHYENETLGERGKNEPKTNPKQSQTKPICFYAQMNATSFITKDYENATLGERGKNEPKTNPKRTQTKPNAKKPKSMQVLF